MGDSMLQTPSTEIPMIKMQGGGSSSDVYQLPLNEIPLVQMKGGGQEDVVAVLAGILATRPEDKEIKETLDATLAAVIGSIAIGQPLVNALTVTAGKETSTQTSTQTNAEGSSESSVTEDYDTKVLSPNEQKLRVRVFPEDKDPENKDSPNNKKILAFLNPKPDTFKFDELKLFQKLLFTQPDVLTFLRSQPEGFIKFWRTYVDHDGTSVITLHTTQAGKQIKSFLNRLHNSRLTYSLYKVKELLRPYEVKKMEQEYGEIKAPFKLADSAKVLADVFNPKTKSVESPVAGNPPPSIQQDYKDPQQKENLDKLSKSLEKLKDARKDTAIVGDTITTADNQLGPYTGFKGAYEGLEACVKEISDIKNNLDNKVAELNAYAEKKSIEKTTPIEQIALRAVIDTHKKIKGEYEKYIAELLAKIKEAGVLLEAEKETYSKVSKAITKFTNPSAPAPPPAKKTPAKKTPAKKTPAKKTPAKKTPAKKKAKEEGEEEEGEEEEREEEEGEEEEGEEEEEEKEEEGEEEEEEEEDSPGKDRVAKAKKALEKQLNTYDGKIDFIKKQFLSLDLDSETRKQYIIDKILIKLFSGKKWNGSEEYCKSFYSSGSCKGSFLFFINESTKRQAPKTLIELRDKLDTTRAIPLNTTIKSLLYLPDYTDEQHTEIRNLLNAFEMQEGLWKNYPNDQGGYRRRTPDHKKSGKRVTRRH
jgi:hypothetical protein